MPGHDIIDNRNERLLDHIRQILNTTERAKFAVGYLFLSGLKPIQQHLERLKEVRLLIGNTTSRETLEVLAEGYKRMDLLEQAAEAMRFVKRTDLRQRSRETVLNIKEAVELMDQTDEDEAVVRTVLNMIVDKRLKVRVYTKGRLHAKAYIFDYRNDGRYEKGVAIVGSSNLSLAGVSHNTELNVVVQGNSNHAELTHWFEELWEEAQEFEESLMNELKESWAVAPVRPYDIYMKTLYALVKDRLEEAEGAEILWDDEITRDLADFQKVAVRQAVQVIRDTAGAFVADVVGLGKSYIGAAIVKHFERTEHSRALIICPASLLEMWERYNECYQLNARVLSMGYLKESGDGAGNILLEDQKFRERDFVLVDESHNFRYSDTQRYRLLQGFLSLPGRKCVFLTATPRNKSAWDIYHQMKLFHQEEKTDLPIDPPDLKQYFKEVEAGKKPLQELLSKVLIRRTRKHVLKWYGYASDTHRPLRELPEEETRNYLDGNKRAYILVAGRHQYFPHRELETIDYSIEATYQGLYQQIRSYLGKPGAIRPRMPGKELTYARYGLWNYVLREKRKEAPYTDLHRAGASLRGLMRILLFKRFESSVFAFQETLRRLHRIHELFLSSLNEGIVPAGDDAQMILYESDQVEEADLIDALRRVSEKYSLDDFDADLLKEHINHDTCILKEMMRLVSPISPDKDAKLQTLLNLLQEPSLSQGKLLIFTQYADTARYLFDNIDPSKERDDIDVIFSGDKSKAKVVGRFAPKANPDYVFPKSESELQTLVATDVLAEGLNLQDCDKVINYDLHWNPVRLIQRLGRIDRIGSEHDVISAYNFLPETELDKNLGLRETLHWRIQEIHDTIGEDSAILDKTEQLNEEAMYAIYEGRADRLDLLEDTGDEFIDLNEAEEILRQLRRDDPVEFEKIANLRDGIRTAKASQQKGLYVFCQAGRYQELFLVDENGKILTQDIAIIISLLKSEPDTASRPLPSWHNSDVMRIKSRFAEEVKHRRAQRRYSFSLTQGQRYVLRELRILFSRAEDDDRQAQINSLERAFRGRVTVAINRELNLLRRNGVSGDALFKSLVNIYHQHDMAAWQIGGKSADQEIEVPRIICSEALI